jgi:hypothetical protein
MSSESASERQRQWELVVRRSFEISDLAARNEARQALIGCLENYLQSNGWQSALRGVSEPIVDSLMVLEVAGDLSDPTFTTRDRAHRLLARGVTVVDPERLVFDARFEYPPEVVAAVEEMLTRVERYAREQQFGD